MRAFGKVAVLMGGPSSEREISFLSGQRGARGAGAARASTHTRSIRRSATSGSCKRDGFARAFIALHGRFGEDGTVQGALETLRIPYTGSGVMASALAMDKWRTKLVWTAAGIPTPRWRVVDARTDWTRVVAELGLPLIVKPAREGSTIGITKVTAADHGELAAAYAAAAQHDPLVLVEEFVQGVELTASIVGRRALPLIRIEAPQGNYDYHNKYFSDETRYLCPAGLAAGRRAGDPRAVARRVRPDRLRGVGPARPDPRRLRALDVSRGQHLARHDRPQPGAHGRARGGHGLRRTLRRDPARCACGMTRRR